MRVVEEDHIRLGLAGADPRCAGELEEGGGESDGKGVSLTPGERGVGVVAVEDAFQGDG